MAEPLFLEGQLPDFSLLQRLLCLEPDGADPAQDAAGSEPAGPAPGTAGSEPAQPERGALLLPPPEGAAAASGPAEPAPPPPPALGLSFLQESARLLDPPAEPGPPGPPEAAGSAGPPEAAASPGPSRGPPAGADALGLISLRCRELAGARGGRRRKQEAPRRGAERRDAAFRGVTLRLRLRRDPRGPGLLLSARAHRMGTRSGRAGLIPTIRNEDAGKQDQEGGAFGGELGASSSSDEDTGPAPGARCCVSCQTRRTPLWRRAGPGMRLCNACGIRYRKHRLRCRRCWNVPRSGRRSHCSGCGAALPPPEPPSSP